MKSSTPQEVNHAHDRHEKGVWSKIGGGALTFAIGFHVILLVVAAIWIFQVTIDPPPDLSFKGRGPEGGAPRAAEQMVAQKRLTQIALSSDPKRVLANIPLPVSVNNSSDAICEFAPLPSIDRNDIQGGLGGNGGDRGIGDGLGDGDGSPRFKSGTLKPNGRLFDPIFSKRCSPSDRLQRLKENGGTPACEDAVMKGLRWLKANQNTDGSWGKGHKPAMTGLALLAYFGHCETPNSTEFGESCMRGIGYLLDLGMKNDGKLAANFTDNSWPYEHAIATYALAEAATLCRDFKPALPNIVEINEITQKAGQWIIDHQNKNGGWAYQYATTQGHTDVSVTGWQLQALRACDHSKLKFTEMTSCVDSGLDYLASCQNADGGFGYTGPGGGHGGYCTLTGTGMLCHQIWNKGKGQEVRKAANYILKNSAFDYNGSTADLYGHYYESQAMMQRGGTDWKQYNAGFREQLLNNQNADGSWKVPGGGKTIRAAGAEYVSDEVYRTCLCTLMLEVYYRFLSTGGGESGGGLNGFNKDRPHL